MLKITLEIKIKVGRGIKTFVSYIKRIFSEKLKRGVSPMIILAFFIFDIGIKVIEHQEPSSRYKLIQALVCNKMEKLSGLES